MRQTKYSFPFCWELRENGTFSIAVLRTKRHAKYTHAYISSQSFENIPQKGPEYSHTARFLVSAVRKNIRRLAVLVGLIFKVSP